MTKIALILNLVLYSLLSYSQAFDTLKTEQSYIIKDYIPLIKQPKSMDCWITVATMMLSWKSQEILTIDFVAQELGEPWKIFYESNSGLPENQQSLFIEKIGLKGEPPASYVYPMYLDLLKKYGPVWIITGDEWVSHAKILIGIEKADNYKETIFHFINPSTGKLELQTSFQFTKEYEDLVNAYNESRKDKKKRKAWKEFRTQIYHF